RAGRVAAPAHRSQNPTPAPSTAPPRRRDIEAGSAAETKGGIRLDSQRGKGPPDPVPLDAHPSDPDPWLCTKLDELHAAVRDNHGRPDGSRTSDLDAGGKDDTAAPGVLAALGRVWLDWLIEAARDGDPAALTHLRDLGFARFDGEADARGQC